MSDMPSEDPVREAFTRYMQRFPDMRRGDQIDATTHALLKQMERMLVAADCAMQDEGLDAQQRRRVISAALYGGPDEEAAVQRMAESEKRLREIKFPPVKSINIEDLGGLR